MRLFLSWSGHISQQIALELHNWLPLILPAVEPFITATDITKGARWQSEISRELDHCNYAVVCLTRDNIASQWIAFEAGAVSKHLTGKVATILFDIDKVQPPLDMFQATRFNYEDMRQLVSNVNDAAAPDKQRKKAQLDVLFAKLWSDFEKRVTSILRKASAQVVQPPPSELVGLRALIQSSNLPMYFTDTKLNVVWCNLSLADLLNTQKSKLEGKHLKEALNYFVERVHESRREQCRIDQKKLIKLSMAEYSPHATREEYIDNRDLRGNTHEGLMRVRIHADKVRTINDEELGIFVVFFLEKIESLPDIASSPL